MGREPAEGERTPIPVTDIFDELQWRGLVAQSTDEAALREALAEGPITLYCGFDPSAPSLHFGNFVQLSVMRRMQAAGHRVICLVGGSTGLIGDPKPDSERVLQDKETIAAAVSRIQELVGPLLDFEGENAATLVNNLDWTAPLSALDFLRDVGRHFRVNQMIRKEAVARRLESDQGISYTEFSYQMLQALDYLELYRSRGCTLQIGGSDQWGNITAGVDLVHRVEGRSVHALATPLLVDSTGTQVRQVGGQRRVAERRHDEPVRLLPVLPQRGGRLRRQHAQGPVGPVAGGDPRAGASRWPRSRSGGRPRRRWPPT